MSVPNRRRVALSLFAAGAAILAWHLAAPIARQEISVSRIAPWGGHAYAVALHSRALPWHAPSDSEGALDASTLTLTEDGQPLGPSHSLHSRIAEAGRGAYSHWGSQIVFSARDNSDPRSNGRRYEARYPLMPAPWLVGLALAAIAASAVLGAGPLVARVARAAGRAAVSLLLTAAALATLTHWLPLHGEVVLPQPHEATRAELGSFEAGDRAGSVKVLAFDRLVAPFVLVPSGSDSRGTGHLALSIDGRPLREVPDISSWLSARDAVFLDADRIGGDALIVYLPPDYASSKAPFVVSWRARATHGALGLLWSLFGIAAAGAALARRFGKSGPAVRDLAAAAGVLGSAGLLLLALNVAGLLVPPPPLDSEIRFPSPKLRGGREHDVIRFDALDRELARRPAEGRAEYAARMNSLVAVSVRHVWNYANATLLDLHVPPWSNYLLWLLGETDARFYRYHYASWRRGLERGAGMCGQVSLILVGLLRDQGFDARVVQLHGHTVVTAEIAPGDWHVLDPDVGVVIPMDLATIERDTEQVRALYEQGYARLGYTDPAAAADAIVAYYDKAGNQVEPRGGNQMLGEAWVRREAFADSLKWVVPAGLLAAALLAGGLASRIRRGREHDLVY